MAPPICPGEQANSPEVQRRAVACSRGRRRRALDRRRAAPAHPGGLAAAGGDPDRLGSADAALLAVLRYSGRATSRYPGPGSMSKAARCRRIHARAIISSMPTPTHGCGRSCRASWRPISRSLLSSADKGATGLARVADSAGREADGDGAGRGWPRTFRLMAVSGRVTLVRVLGEGTRCLVSMLTCAASSWRTVLAGAPVMPTPGRRR
jgi:hypothetical protein